MKNYTKQTFKIYYQNLKKYKQAVCTSGFGKSKLADLLNDLLNKI